MLKSLRRKFVLIIMILVGTVLVSVLGGTYASAWVTQHDIIDDALERGLTEDIFMFPQWGMLWDDEDGGRPDDNGRANVPILRMDVDSSGKVLYINDSSLLKNVTSLSVTINQVQTSESDSSWDTATHLAWMRAQRESGTWRIVIADTSAADLSLQSLAIKDVAIFVAAMGALLVIAILLSTWVLKPVEAAWEQQRQFIADASHELKTPLAVIIANTQILEADQSIPAESRRWIQSTAEESKHMKNLVEELLELARTDETATGAHGVMKQEEVDFSAMVENAALEFDAIAFERGSEIQEQIDEGVRVKGDAEWLMRLCKILIDNACKYSLVGTPVLVSLRQESRRCTLSVTNQGNVIDPEDLPHVFDRFYRTDKARSRDAHTGGFGLGLAIAKGICTSHGGTISVTSSAEAGTTFCATLPTL